MNQTMNPATRIRPIAVRPETASALRDIAFVLALTQRVREAITSEPARQ